MCTTCVPGTRGDWKREPLGPQPSSTPHLQSLPFPFSFEILKKFVLNSLCARACVHMLARVQLLVEARTLNPWELES